MTLCTQLTDYINAAFTGLWIETHEPDEAEREITQHAREQQWKLAVWDIASGVRFPLQRNSAATDTGAGDPLAALKALPALGDGNGTAVLLLHHFHRFLNNPEVVQNIFQQIVAGKARRTFVVVLAPVVVLPPELEKLFVVLEHALPDRGQLERIARELTSDAPEEFPTDAELPGILDAAVGLTRYESEGAFALSLARHGRIKLDTIWDLKAQAVKKSGLATIYRGSDTFDCLGGMSALKELCRRALRPTCPVAAKGFILLSPPGCGKTSVAKAIGGEMKRPVLFCDPGMLKDKYVGESEAKVRRFIQIAEAMAPCVVLIDEIEKALAGATGKSQGDSGVSADQLRTLLTWRQDSTAPVFVIGTCNDAEAITKVSGGALTREDRFDGLVFIDLPSRAEKDRIWDIWRKQYQIDPDQARPDDTNWTGAEIKACCRKSLMYDLPLADAAAYVTHIDVEQVEALRTWASGKCLSAATPGIYRRPGTEVKSARRLNRNPSNN
jgi:ATPase family associated with various cellular activities (AAA)